MSHRTTPLFPALAEGSTRPALTFGERTLSYGELAASVSSLAARLGQVPGVAVWATPTLETAVGVVAALLAGVPAIPLNPKVGERELAHIVSDSFYRHWSWPAGATNCRTHWPGCPEST